MRCRGVLVGFLAVGAACSSSEEPTDPLDRELLGDLALAQGSATGAARSGSFTVEFSQQSCDCPSFEFDGQVVDLCALASFASLEADVVEGSGVLGVSGDELLLTGAIEADDSFVIAGISDISTVIGPLEALRRIDGEFSDDDHAQGWAGQRLLGELASDAIDCRWTGSFVATRN